MRSWPTKTCGLMFSPLNNVISKSYFLCFHEIIIRFVLALPCLSSKRYPPWHKPALSLSRHLLMSQQILRNVPPIVFVQDKEAAALAEVRPLGNGNVNFYVSKISKKMMRTV